MVGGTHCPYVSICGYEVVRGAAALKGLMTYAYCLVSFRDLSLNARIWASKLVFGPQGSDLGLNPGILPQGWNFGLKAGIWASKLIFGSQVWDLDIKAGIWVSRLGFGLKAGIWASRPRFGP